jgi:hypothetical protein
MECFCFAVGALQGATISDDSIELALFIVRLKLNASTDRFPVDHGFSGIFRQNFG